MKEWTLSFLCLLASATVGFASNLDSDGDGLSDFQEKHKYRTDPHKRDVHIPEAEFAKMVKGVQYKLEPVNSKPEY